MTMQVSKITLTSYNPKVIAAQPDEVRRLVVGSLIGRAISTVRRKSPDGATEFVGLSGAFEAHFAVADNSGKIPESISSGVLFIPPTFQDGLVELLSDQVNKEGVVVREAADAVQFAFNVIVARAGNAQGYEWMLEPLYEAAPEERVDVLADMRKLLAAPAEQAKLAAPKEKAKA